LDEHLLFQRRLRRKGFALIRTENAILDESLRWRFFVTADLSIFLACGIIMSQTKGGCFMDTKKYEIEVDDFEHRMLVQALSEKRNELISEDKSTANIDALLLKAIDAKPKKKKK